MLYNIEQATITSQNINQEGLDTTVVTTTNYEHNEIKPDYTGIATGAAVTGFVAGVIVTGEALLTDYVGSKPTGETAQLDYAVLKPDPTAMINNPEFAAQVNALYPDYLTSGVINPNAQNMGLANITDSILEIGKPVIKPQGLFYEGSWLMGNIESTIGGMHYMSLFHDGWATNSIIGAPVINQLSIIPAVGLNYCVLAGGACAGVVTPSPPPSKSKSGENINLSKE